MNSREVGDLILMELILPLLMTCKFVDEILNTTRVPIVSLLTRMPDQWNKSRRSESLSCCRVLIAWLVLCYTRGGKLQR